MAPIISNMDSGQINPINSGRPPATRLGANRTKPAPTTATPAMTFGFKQHFNMFIAETPYTVGHGSLAGADLSRCRQYTPHMYERQSYRCRVDHLGMVPRIVILPIAPGRREPGYRYPSS